MNKRTKIVNCFFCNKKITVSKYASNKQSCSECREKGLIIKDGRSNNLTKQKREVTNLKKFGVKYPAKSKEIKEKTKQTNLKKRGVLWGFQDKEIKNKIEKTNLHKYGNTNPALSKIIKEKIKKKSILRRRNIIKEQTKTKLNLEIISEYNNQNEEILFKCLKCGHIFKDTYFNVFQRMYPCPKCRPKNYNTSSYEKEIFNFLKEFLSSDILINDRNIIPPKELDIYIPDKKIAIEINGVRWHSDIFGINKSYHLNKLIICQKQNIQLIHIFEDEWLYKQDIVKARLKQILNSFDGQRIHARKCVIKEISPKIKNEFLEKYHIQGKDNSIVKLGAFYNDELVSVMTFSHGNISKGSKSEKEIWELNRFCSNYNYHIPGIASKLLTYFKRNYEWKEIFSYADRRWSTGNVYEKLGFELNSITQPNYWYIQGLQRIHRFGLRKRNDEPENITEWELRRKEGYDRIWDCGSLKYVIKQ